MPRWPLLLLLLACVPSCTNSIETPVTSKAPARVFVEAPCIESDSEIGLFFEGRIGLRLPPGVAAKDLNGRSSSMRVGQVEVGCNRASVWMGVFEVQADLISFADLLCLLLRTHAGGCQTLRLEFVRPHLDGFSVGMSDDATDPRHVYVRVMMPSDRGPSRYHAIQFIADSPDWERLLAELEASADSLARLPR